MIRALVGLFFSRCPYCKSVEFRSVGVPELGRASLPLATPTLPV